MMSELILFPAIFFNVSDMIDFTATTSLNFILLISLPVQNFYFRSFILTYVKILPGAKIGTIKPAGL